MTSEKGGRPSSADEDRIAIRRIEALRLRAQGKPHREIAEALGVSIATAHGDVRAAMTEAAEEAQADIKASLGLGLARLDRAMRVVEEVLEEPEPVAAKEGEELDDFEHRVESSRELKLKALDRLVKLEEQRAKLLGLYAPEKRDISASVVGEVSPEAAARLVRETFGAAALPKGTPPTGEADTGSGAPVPEGSSGQ